MAINFLLFIFPHNTHVLDRIRGFLLLNAGFQIAILSATNREIQFESSTVCTVAKVEEKTRLCLY